MATSPTRTIRPNSRDVPVRRSNRRTKEAIPGALQLPHRSMQKWQTDFRSAICTLNPQDQRYGPPPPDEEPPERPPPDRPPPDRRPAPPPDPAPADEPLAEGGRLLPPPAGAERAGRPDEPDAGRDAPPRPPAAGAPPPPPPPPPLPARRSAFSLARFRSSAFRARISAIRSAIGTSKRCFGLVA